MIDVGMHCIFSCKRPSTMKCVIRFPSQISCLLCPFKLPWARTNSQKLITMLVHLCSNPNREKKEVHVFYYGGSKYSFNSVGTFVNYHRAT